MKKKRIILIALILVFFLLVTCVTAYLIPISSFRRNVNQYKKYVVLEDEHTLTRVRQRLEMSREEYLKLKEELLSDGWIDSTEFIAENGMDDLSTAYFSEEERKVRKKN